MLVTKTINKKHKKLKTGDWSCIVVEVWWFLFISIFMKESA